MLSTSCMKSEINFTKFRQFSGHGQCVFAFAVLQCNHSRWYISHAMFTLPAQELVLSASPGVVSTLVFGCAPCASIKRRGLGPGGEGCCGRVSVFQAHTQRNDHLSCGTIHPPVAVHGCWTCFLPFSLLHPSLPPFEIFLPLYKHKSLSFCCQPWLLWKIKCLDRDERSFWLSKKDGKQKKVHLCTLEVRLV